MSGEILLPMAIKRSKDEDQLSTILESETSSLTVVPSVTPSIFSDDETLNEEVNPRRADKIIVDDWSCTGQGSHVEFKNGETVPLEQGKEF